MIAFSRVRLWLAVVMPFQPSGDASLSGGFLLSFCQSASSALAELAPWPFSRPYLSHLPDWCLMRLHQENHGLDSWVQHWNLHCCYHPMGLFHLFVYVAWRCSRIMRLFDTVWSANFQRIVSGNNLNVCLLRFCDMVGSQFSKREIMTISYSEVNLFFGGIVQLSG